MGLAVISSNMPSAADAVGSISQDMNEMAEATKTVEPSVRGDVLSTPAYRVIRPTVATNSSTLCLCSTTSPEAKAPATQ